MQQQSGTDLTTRLIIGLSALMTLMIAVVIYTVIFRYEDPWSDEQQQASQGPKAGGPLACDASDIAGVNCPAGYYCHFDTCRPVELTQLCSEGDSCKDCDCKDGLVCHHYRCVNEANVDRTPLECEKNEKLAEAVKTLAVKCSKRNKSVDDIVSTGSCSAADWKDLALEDDKFDLLLAAFPDRFAVLFPPGRPYLKKQDWPTPAVREHYAGQFRRFREPLSRAKQIFVIGRSSPDGNAETNRLLSLARMSLVGDLIEAAVHEGLSETEKSRSRPPRLRSFALASENAIDPARFKESYLGAAGEAAPLEKDRLVLPDAATRTKIEAALEGGVDLKNREAPGWQELFGALNRVVLVIPIPCTGDEYTPPKSVLAPAGQ